MISVRFLRCPVFNCCAWMELFDLPHNHIVQLPGIGKMKPVVPQISGTFEPFTAKWYKKIDRSSKTLGHCGQFRLWRRSWKYLVYSEIDHTYLSIEAQRVSHHYPRWTATQILCFNTMLQYFYINLVDYREHLRWYKSQPCIKSLFLGMKGLST